MEIFPSPLHSLMSSCSRPKLDKRKPVTTRAREKAATKILTQFRRGLGYVTMEGVSALHFQCSVEAAASVMVKMAQICLLTYDLKVNAKTKASKQTKKQQQGNYCFPFCWKHYLYKIRMWRTLA